MSLCFPSPHLCFGHSLSVHVWACGHGCTSWFNSYHFHLCNDTCLLSIIPINCSINDLALQPFISRLLAQPCGYSWWLNLLPGFMLSYNQYGVCSSGFSMFLRIVSSSLSMPVTLPFIRLTSIRACFRCSLPVRYSALVSNATSSPVISPLHLQTAINHLFLTITLSRAYTTQCAPEPIIYSGLSSFTNVPLRC